MKNIQYAFCLCVILTFFYMISIAKPFATNCSPMSTGIKVGSVNPDGFIAKHLTHNCEDFCEGSPECYPLDKNGNPLDKYGNKL